MNILSPLSRLANYITHADFLFPATWQLFISDTFHTWDYLNGSLNTDSILRLPLKIVLSPFYLVGGQTLFSLAYMAFIFGLSFYVFKKFLKDILKVEDSKLTRFILPIMFAFNPVFLGNSAKLGIQLGVVSTLGALVYLNKYLHSENVKKYLWVFLIFVHLSLVHPFTFLITATICFALALSKHKQVIRKYRTLAGGALTFIGVHLFAILPLISSGVSKDQLFVDNKQDPAAIIDIANNKSLLEAISQSKSVFLDFDFYNSFYRPLYFLGSLGIVFIVIKLLKTNFAQINPWSKKATLTLLTSTLLLTLLSTSSHLFGDLLKNIVNLPGGWAFRSPLKWQLYLPVTIFGLIALLHRPGSKSKALSYLLIGFWALSVSYVSLQVASKLVLPKTVNTLQSVEELIEPNKQILYVTNGACLGSDYSTSRNQEINNEINYLLAASGSQTHRISTTKIPTTNLNNYDYVLACHGEEIESTLIASEQNFIDQRVHFYELDSFANGVTVGDISNSTSEAVNDITNQLSLSDIIYSTESGEQTESIPKFIEVFSDISSSNFDESSKTINQDLVLNIEKPYALIGNESNLGYQDLGDSNYNFSIKTDGYSLSNLVSNGDFSQGFWQPNVGDCYNYDDSPEISQNLSSPNQELNLVAKNHFACTEQTLINLDDTQDGLFVEFNYRLLDENSKGQVLLIFNDEEQTKERFTLNFDDSSMKRITRTIDIPEGADNARLLLYSIPKKPKQNDSIVSYDNVFITAVPDDIENSYLLRDSEDVAAKYQVTTKHNSYTKWSVDVENVQQAEPFYFVLKERFNSSWQLQDKDKNKLSDLNLSHKIVNDRYSSWYFEDVEALCSKYSSLCEQQADGAYKIQFNVVFANQSKLELGLILSAASLLTATTYERSRRNKGVKYD